MDWKWPAEHNVDCKDFHPRIGGGQEEVGGWGRGTDKLANACDSSAAGYFLSPPGFGVNRGDYIDFIFTFDDAKTWVSGYRQFGNVFPVTRWSYRLGRYYTAMAQPSKDIEIYTADANFAWTRVATDRHSNWHNGATNTFPNGGTTTEWKPTSPSKYLKVRTRTNYGYNYAEGVLTVRFLQLKFSAPSN